MKVQKTFDNAGGKPTRGFSLQHQTFFTSALPYAQDFGITVNYEFEVAYIHEKSNCPVSNTFMPFVSTHNLQSLQSVQTVTKTDKVVVREWIENFRPV